LTQQHCRNKGKPMLVLLLSLALADTLYLADHVLSVPKSRAGIIVRDGKIAFVGEEPQARTHAGPTAKVHDFGHATIAPGFIDAHAHLANMGRAAREVDLFGTKSAEDVAARVREFVKAHPQASYVRGRGWDQNDWQKTEMPTSAVLDKISKTIPIVLDRVDGHAIWTNTAAMKDVPKTDPEGGRILRDKAGKPTGVFVDTAEDVVEAKLPPPTQAEVEQDLLEGQKRAFAAGLTGIHDMGVDATTLAAYKALGHKLRLRVHAALASAPKLGPQTEDGRLAVRAVKLFADGALGSRGARLIAPYTDEPAHQGLWVMPPDELKATVAKIAEAGFQPCVHAIGDAAVRATLDAFAALSPEIRARVRPRVEHAQVIAPADFDRFAILGVIASMQPMHWTSDSPWAEKRVGPERIKGAYAWRTLLQKKARLAFGSDAPVEKPDILPGLKAALAQLTLPEAIDAFTRGAAYAAFRENELGALEPGKLADFTIFPGTIESAIERAAPLQVVIGGEIEQ
jgi:hypothetical protein